MLRLPVIVGFGGVSGAGRSSFNHGYRRLILDALDSQRSRQTYASLASLMQLETAADGPDDSQREFVRDHTLIRRIEKAWFDVEAVQWNKRMTVSAAGEQGASFTVRRRQLPDPLPPNWTVSSVDERTVRVDVAGDTDFLVPSLRQSAVQTASQLPSGFDPGALYPARSHPRGLQMTVFGASDAVQSMGLDWEAICQRVRPDQISVYSASAMGQLDPHGHGGMIGSRFNDKRTTSKHCPFGLAEMPADFINAYVLGASGNTGGYVGACATFLYNLRQGVADIKNGVARVVLVGSAEAPLNPDVIEGYAAMGALATAEEVLALDRHLGRTEPDYRRSSRPFSTNCGFTIAESSQYVVLMDDELAMEMGARILGAVPDVFVNADGHKKSIASPGIGNYITMAKAMASTRALLGEESFQQRSYVHAHGTSTPQNRVSESQIMDQLARTFGIRNWPVTAVKAYLGHSLGAAAGDQLMAALGVWSDGIIPGIATIDHVAEDVHNSHLQIGSEHLEVGPEGVDSTVINSKGFGGNNASAAVIAPHIVHRMLAKRYGSERVSAYRDRNEAVEERAAAYDAAATRGEARPLYRFDHNVLQGEDLEVSDTRIAVPGYGEVIDLEQTSPYSDWL